MCTYIQIGQPHDKAWTIIVMCCVLFLANCFLFLVQKRSHPQRRERKSILLHLNRQMKEVIQTGRMQNRHLKLKAKKSSRMKMIGSDISWKYKICDLAFVYNFLNFSLTCPKMNLCWTGMLMEFFIQRKIFRVQPLLYCAILYFCLELFHDVFYTSCLFHP